MSDSQEDGLAQMRPLLELHGDLGSEAIAAAPAIWPDYDIESLVREWQRMGSFSLGGVQAWLSARCFSPWAAAELIAANVTSEMAAQRTELGDGPPDTIAFKCSARALSILDALVALGIGTLVLDEDQQQHLTERNSQLADASTRLLDAPEDLKQTAAAGAIYLSEASDTVFATLTAIRRLSETLGALAGETYHPLAHALFHDELPRHEDASVAARTLADALDAFAGDLRALHDAHYPALAGHGTLAPSHFGLRVVRRDGRDPDPHYGPHAR